MKSLGLIIQREYSSRVKTKAFILTTILTPIFILLSFVIPNIIANMKSGDITEIYVVDNSGMYKSILKDTKDFSFNFVDKEQSKKNEGTTSYALLTIDADLSKIPGAATFYSEKQQPPAHIISYINKSLSDAVKDKQLKEYASTNQISDDSTVDIINIVNKDNVVNVNTYRLNEKGDAVDTVSELTSIIGFVFTIITFFFVMMYGAIVLQSVIEEKTNRIIEVIISSVKPFTLLTGKIIAVALMGVTQIIFWTIIIFIGFLAFSFWGSSKLSADEMQQVIGMDGNHNMIALAIGNQMQTVLSVNWLQVGVCFVFYFIGGYLLYASLFAMFGAAASDAQEAQQYTTPLSMILIIAMYLGFAASKDPEGHTAFWSSLVPFTSPVVMMARAPLEIPFWEIALSICILYITAGIMIFLAAKIYKTGILMHGKKINIKEVIKWISYK